MYQCDLVSFSIYLFFCYEMRILECYFLCVDFQFWLIAFLSERMVCVFFETMCCYFINRFVFHASASFFNSLVVVFEEGCSLILTCDVLFFKTMFAFLNL